jgi:hypothetical protein
VLEVPPCHTYVVCAIALVKQRMTVSARKSVNIRFFKFLIFESPLY